MSSPLQQPAMDPDALLMLQVLGSAMQDAGVCQALEADDISGTSLMQALLDHLKCVAPCVPADLVLARSTQQNQGNGGHDQAVQSQFFSVYLRINDWFMTLDLDPVFTPTHQPMPGVLAFAGEQAVFDFERQRLSAPASLHQGLLPATRGQPCPVSSALAAACIAPLLSCRAQRLMQHATPACPAPPEPCPRL